MTGISGAVIPDERPTVPCAVATSKIASASVNSDGRTANNTNSETPNRRRYMNARVAAARISSFASSAGRCEGP